MAGRLRSIAVGSLAALAVAPACARADEPGGLGTHARRCGAPLVARAAVGAPTIGEAITSAAQRGAITLEQRDAYLAIYSAARHARDALGGVRRAELGSVLAVTADLAAGGLLTSTRMPAVFLTLQRNTEYWRGNAPPRQVPSGQSCSGGVGYSLPRITFGDDPVVFQYYPGHGLQIQVLGNFGKANALAQQCLEPTPKAPCRPDKLKALLDRLVALRATRGSYTTWEYYFPFGRGRAPWVSGMAQATALQALARASRVLGDPSYLEVAREALGAFQAAPPEGVRVFADGGSHYLIYSFDSHLRVLNAFLQSLIGLFDYAQISGDPVAHELFDAGDRAARVEVPRYDTGAWSLYSLGGGESNLDYHRLVTDFLGRLCDRTQAGVYCATAGRFTSYLTQAPGLAFAGTSRARRHRPATVSVRLSKLACVKVAVTRRGRLTFVRQYVFPRGLRSFAFVPPRRGAYRVVLDAHDLAGNRTVLRGTIRVR
jgi:hypothetical protein